MARRPPEVNPVIVRGDLSEELLAAFLAQPEVAVDTETMGLQTLRDRLCLVQMCNRAGTAAMVQIQPDQLAPEIPPADRAPRLKRLLEDPNVLKVFHFARFDLAALRHYLGIKVAPLYCTRTVSKLVRTYTDRHGLKDNVFELLGIEMDKAQQSSDWSSPQLSADQIRYAISDVTALLDLKDQLHAMLMRQGRESLALDCFRALPTFAELDILGFVDLFEH